MMMGGGMIYGSILLAAILAGFAYIVWVNAAKESGGVKSTGQVIAIILAVLAMIVLLYSGVYGGMMGQGICGGGAKMGPGMMMREYR